MAKTITETMDGLREDVARWKSELERLRSEGAKTSAEHIEKLIGDAELILSRWDNPKP